MIEITTPTTQPVVDLDALEGAYRVADYDTEAATLLADFADAFKDVARQTKDAWALLLEESKANTMEIEATTHTIGIISLAEEMEQDIEGYLREAIDGMRERLAVGRVVNLWLADCLEDKEAARSRYYGALEEAIDFAPDAKTKEQAIRRMNDLTGNY